MNKPSRDQARSGAIGLLAGIRDGMGLGDQIAAGALDRLSPPDRARAGRLAADVLRHLDQADAVLAPLLARKPRPEIRDLLRLATVEMLELNEAPHGAVNAAVTLARMMGPKGRAASGMVNAVLRKVSQSASVWAAQPPQMLPSWLRKPLIKAYGADAVRDMELAHQNGAPIDLTAKPDLSAPGDPLPTGSYRLMDAGQISVLPGYETGDWWVQDTAASLAARLLDPQPGETILDLCAAPGGKTLQLAAAGAHVTAVDLSESRLVRLTENLTRCGLAANVVAADALTYRPDTPPDAILLDAPCSATGTIRRHPDLPLIRDGQGLADITALQAALIDHALEILRPGGRLVFATCSLLPQEGEDQLGAALQRHPGIIVEKPVLAGIIDDWITPQGGLRLRPDYWPERGGMDGFFIACLRKPDAPA